jgi:hypothetical protein
MRRLLRDKMIMFKNIYTAITLFVMIVSSMSHTHSAGAYIEPANEPGKTPSITSLAPDRTKTPTVNTAKKRRQYIVTTLGGLAIMTAIVLAFNRKQSPQDVSSQDSQKTTPIAPPTTPGAMITADDPFADVYNQAYAQMRPHFDDALKSSLPQDDRMWTALMFFLCFDRTRGVISTRADFIESLNKFEEGGVNSNHMIFENFLYKACGAALQPKPKEKRCQLETEFDIIKNFPSILSGTADSQLLQSISPDSKEKLQNAKIAEYEPEIKAIIYDDVLKYHQTFQTLKEKFQAFSKFWKLRYEFQLMRSNSLGIIIPLLQNAEYANEFPVLLKQLIVLNNEIMAPTLSAADRYALHKQIHTTLKDDIEKLVPKLHFSFETSIEIFVRTLESVLECDPSFTADSKIDLGSVFKTFKQE